MRRHLLCCVPMLLVLGAAPVLAQEQVESFAPEFFAAARPATAMDMINRLPGFAFDGGDGSRGFSGSAGNVLIDGKRPSSKTDSLHQVLQRLLADDVARIDVIRGGAPGIDMQGKPVVANIVRRTVDSTSIVITAGANYFNTGRVIPMGQVQYSRTVGDRSYDFSIRRDANFGDDMGAADITRIDPLGAGITTLQRRRSSGGVTGLNGAVAVPFLGGELGANATLNQNENSNETVYSYAAGPQRFFSTNRNQNGEIGVNYRLALGEAVLDLVGLQRLGHQVSSQKLDTDAGSDIFSSLRDTGESIGRASLRYPLSDLLTAEGGAELAYNSLDGLSILRQGGATVTLPSSQVSVSEERGEVFLQASWQARDALVLEGGLRAEYSTITTAGAAGQSRAFFYPKPRAQLAWNVTPRTMMRLRLEKRVGQLNFGDFVSSANLNLGNVTAGNPELEPDRRWEYELVLEHHFWERGALKATLLHQDITNLIDNKPLVTPAGIFDVRGNIGDARSDRLTVEASLPTDFMGINGGLFSLTSSFRDSRLTDPVTGRSRRLSYEDPTNYQVNFSQDLVEWKSTWNISYANGWHEIGYRLSQIDRSYGSPTMHATWTYKPSADLNVTFTVNNFLPSNRTRDTRYLSGPRGQGAFLRREIENSHARPRLFVSVRKTLG